MSERTPRAGTRSELRARLEARREEIEVAVLTRITAIADPSAVADPAYADGLRRAVVAALDYGLSAIDAGEGREPPIPLELLAQARNAARNRVSLDAVMRRYFGGYSLLGYFIVEEASRERLIDGAELQRLIGAQAALFDRLLAAVGEEHARELAGAEERTAERRRLDAVRRLLDGERIESTWLGYDFEGCHIGIVTHGADSVDRLREVARRLDRTLLLAWPDESTAWAWFGGRRPLEPESVVSVVAETLPAGRALALGEPGEGLAGWRLTHRQALVAWPIALRRHGGICARYADVALLAAASQDELLVKSLDQLYLEPLRRKGARGELLQQTLQAYLETEGTVTSAATLLGVTRKTVRERLRSVEERIGKPLHACMLELRLALDLESLGSTSVENPK